jgi:hypothetical protein
MLENLPIPGHHDVLIGHFSKLNDNLLPLLSHPAVTDSPLSDHAISSSTLCGFEVREILMRTGVCAHRLVSHR